MPTNSIIHLPNCSLTYPMVHSRTKLFIHLPSCSFTYPIIHWPMQSFIHLPNHSFIYPLLHINLSNHLYATTKPTQHPIIYYFVYWILQGNDIILEYINNSPIPANSPTTIRVPFYEVTWTKLLLNTYFIWMKFLLNTLLERNYY